MEEVVVQVVVQEFTQFAVHIIVVVQVYQDKDMQVAAVTINHSINNVLEAQVVGTVLDHPD
jgi:hypothetical protein